VTGMLDKHSVFLIILSIHQRADALSVIDAAW